MKAADRNDKLMSAAARLVSSGGCYLTLSREEIAKAAKCAPTLINHHFVTMERFRQDLMRWAVRTRCLPIIAQGLAHRDRTARRAPWDVQSNARDLL
tara:strand:- start:329 stop:619 length:291 start_codon:yes stop_codon:yes gene_type:complete